MFEQLGLIGCGLMGLFRPALKRAGLVKRVVGYSKSPTTHRTRSRSGRDRSGGPRPLRGLRSRSGFVGCARVGY